MAKLVFDMALYSLEKLIEWKLYEFLHEGGTHYAFDSLEKLVENLLHF
jgi:predicted DNA repair protein MutK